MKQELPNDLVKQVEDKMLETMLLAQEKFKRTFDLPALTFEGLRGKRVAGRANYDDYLIRINPAFLVQFSRRVIDRTVPHELAHLITHIVYPNHIQHHGPEWRQVMKLLEVQDCSRCHDMQLK